MAGVVMVVLVVACSSSPELTADDQARLTADAVARACADVCEAATVVQAWIFTSGPLSSQGETMPPGFRQAISEVLPEARFMTPEEARSVIEGAEPGTTVISVGPVLALATDVVGIEVGVGTSGLGGHGSTYQYMWKTTEWIPATSDETGITVATWVS